ncbi:hypothetical protein MBT84_27395 [Streptomyces sp. MBT84]|uniref:hypothetical protein n=1 Tax=unclassified Streptomyces TaxID=2593676 RepID=UPI00074102F7|nr:MULTISPECIES: hypothetical protein [unclassified Streptomyces]KUJ36648.1 hypothetical protein ADL25_31420 [Streptomyces sp. NRRL F-5122]MBW8703326.1 hypothetical protein [Streptomyces sp. MBT84]MDX3264093.1 hypothetical protein [Streptomyces sp. MI02-2A]REE60851.1 hypothetical protein BX257_3405 [Streptomyces sp. 3212.3]
MTSESHTPPPAPTKDDFAKVLSFIGDRLAPLLVTDDPRYAPVATSLDFAVRYLHGMAELELDEGGPAYKPFSALTRIAEQWKEHPDFDPGWTEYWHRQRP